MRETIDRLVGAWTRVPTGDGDDDTVFNATYTDPVVLNGDEVRVADLVARYRSLHAAFADIRIDVLDAREADGTLAVVLRQRGRHVGPFPAPTGTLAATGREFDVLGIDVLTVAGGRVSRIWVVADELGRLTQLGALGTPD